MQFLAMLQLQYKQTWILNALAKEKHEFNPLLCKIVTKHLLYFCLTYDISQDKNHFFVDFFYYYYCSELSYNKQHVEN